MKNNILNKSDFIIGSLLTIIMAVIFSVVGGLPLMITFVPGLIFTWIAFFLSFF